MNCPNCGSDNAAGAGTCANCGQALTTKTLPPNLAPAILLGAPAGFIVFVGLVASAAYFGDKHTPFVWGFELVGLIAAVVVLLSAPSRNALNPGLRAFLLTTAWIGLGGMALCNAIMIPVFFSHS